MLRIDHRITRATKPMLLWLPVLATVLGYVAYSLYDPAQVPRAKTLALIALAINVLAMFAHGFRREIPLPALVGGMWLAAAMLHIGLAPAMATLLIALCAIGLGSLLTSRDSEADGLGALLVGLGLMAAAVGWLLPFPIHRQWLYFALALVVVIVRGSTIRRLLAVSGGSFLSATKASPQAAFVVINVIGICSTPSWLPTMQADDISYHLALPFQLQDLGYYKMDVAGSVFALAPWSTDVVQAMAQVIADTEARGAINLMWMLALYAGMWRLGRMFGLPPLLAWAAIALHCSLPISSYLLGGMQTELPTSAILIGLMILIGTSPTLTAPRLGSIAVLAGLLLATKASNALLLLPVALWLGVRSATSLPWRAVVPCSLLGAFVALPSYVYAYAIAGNPFLPLFNGIFQSPHFILENWKDPAWMHPINATLPWQLTFETSKYLTAEDGAAGFAYLVCTAGLLAALFDRNWRQISIIGIACFLLVFLQIHFIRYTHPATALLILAAMGGFHSMGMQRALAAATAVLCVLNLSLLGSAYWQLRDGALDLFVREGRDATIQRFAPQRTVAGKIRAAADGDTRALFHNVDAHGNAELTLPAVSTSWYNWTMVRQAGAADADRSGQRWREIFSKHGINLLVVDRDKISDGLRNALSSFVIDPSLSQANYEVWRIKSSSMQGMPLQLVDKSKDHATFKYTDIEGGSRISTRAKFRCDRPDEPIVISISALVKSSDSPENLISGWAMCKSSGFAEGEVEARAPQDLIALSFIVSPRSPMAFEMLESSSTIEKGAQQAPSDPARSIQGQLRDLLSLGEER